MDHKTSCKTGSISLTEEEIANFMTKFDLTREEVLEFQVEFNAYDIDGNGNITFEDLQYVNKAFEWNIENDTLDNWTRKSSDIAKHGKVSINQFVKQRKQEQDFLKIEL